MEGSDDHCFLMKGKKVCVEPTGEGTAFDSARSYMVSNLEGSKNDSPYRLVKTCSLQGRECFKRNLTNASFFIILFLISGMMLNFLHELVHYAFLASIGYTSVEFTFSSNFGMTVGSLPAMDDPTIPWHWWTLELLGPILLVNFPFLIMSMVAVKHSDPNPVYNDRTGSQTVSWLGKNFLKALAYGAAFSILANTLISPFYSMIFGFLGDSRPFSDFELLWQVTYFMGAPFDMMTRILFIIISSMVVSITILFIMMYNRRDMGT